MQVKQIISQSLSRLPQNSKQQVDVYQLEGDELMVANNHRLNLPIRRFDNQAKVELVKRLGSLSESLGIKQISKKPLEYILENLQENFSDFTMQDIDTAFKFAFSGKLNIEIKHFQSFDITYISPILVAYREYRNGILLKQQILEHQKQLAEEKLKDEKGNPIDVNDPAQWEISYNKLLNFVKSNKKFPAGWNWEMVFFHMEEAGLIKDTKEEKFLFRDNVIAELNEEYKGDYKKVKEVISNETRLVLECRKRRVQKYLEKYL